MGKKEVIFEALRFIEEEIAFDYDRDVWEYPANFDEEKNQIPPNPLFTILEIYLDQDKKRYYKGKQLVYIESDITPMKTRKYYVVEDGELSISTYQNIKNILCWRHRKHE